MQKYLVEMIGAFFLCLTFVLTTTQSGLELMAPAALGLMLTALLYAGGPVSGGHFNPALSLGAMIRGRFHTNDTISYMLAQCLGAMAAAAIGAYLHGAAGEAVIQLHTNNDPVGALLAEFLGAFVLAYVYLSVYGNGRTQEQPYFGLSVGLCLAACAYSLGPVSGGLFNPALALGAAIAGILAFSDLWLYITGALAGAAAAATVYTALFGRAD